MAVSFIDSKAIVTYNSTDGKSLNWKYEDVKVRSSLKPDEVLVAVKYVGICHTDIALGTETASPKILGHEGVGVIEALGDNVEGHNIGDRVILSYAYCESCDYCTKGETAYCESFTPKNLAGTDSELTFYKGSKSNKIEGKFFGQSTFAKLTTVDKTSVVNLEKLPKPVSDEQFKHLGPFACGFQTGSGAILNAGELKKGESVVIYGIGGVGFAGLLAAKIGGAATIIAVDLLDSKLELAKKAGATHLIKPSREDPDFVANEIKKITNGRGVDLSLECIGGSRFVEAAIASAAPKGRIVFLGVSTPDDVIKVPLFEFLLAGKRLISCIEGDATPKDFIPKLINWYLTGEFVVDDIIKVYPVEEFETALQELKEGKVIKPILEF